MDSPIKNLHYAIGEMAYCIANIDGKVQKEEREKFHSIIVSELKDDHDFDISDIIFQIMDKDKQDSETVFKWAVKEVNNNSHYLSPKLKSKFINVMENIAKAFPPVTKEERDMIDKFKKLILPLKGDPVYYASKVR